MCFVLAALEVDGKQVSPGTACSAACGRAVSLVCTISNCTGGVLTGLTVELHSVVLVQSGTPISVQSDATDGHAAFDSNALAIGCLMSAFPQVHLTKLLIEIYCHFCFVILYLLLHKGCRVAQLVKCLVTSGYPDGSSSGGPRASSGKTHIVQSRSTTVQR